MTDSKLEKRISALEKELSYLKANPLMPDHFHNGSDASRINFNDLDQKKHWISYTIPGTNSATAANYSVFFVNEIGPCYVSAFYEVHETAGTDAGAVTVMLEKLTGTTAPASGSSVLTTALSLKATANTVQEGTLTNTFADRNLAAGDRLALKDSGTLTAVANVTVFVELTIT